MVDMAFSTCTYCKYLKAFFFSYAYGGLPGTLEQERPMRVMPVDCVVLIMYPGMYEINNHPGMVKHCKLETWKRQRGDEKGVTRLKEQGSTKSGAKEPNRG